MATATTRTTSAPCASALTTKKPAQLCLEISAHAPARAANPPDLQPAPPAEPRPASRRSRPQPVDIRRTSSQDSLGSTDSATPRDIITPKDQLMRSEAVLDNGPPPILRLAAARPQAPPPPPSKARSAGPSTDDEDELQLRDQSVSGAPPGGSESSNVAPAAAGRPPKPKVRLVEPPMPVNPYIAGACDGRQAFQAAESCLRPEGYSRFLWDYHQEVELGQGNFSKVYRAVHRLTGAAFAVKTNRVPITTLQARNMWLNEMQALAAVQVHPHIVGLHDAWFEGDARASCAGSGGAALGRTAERIFIKMELCGDSLGSFVRRRLQLSEQAAVDLLRQMASALKRVHDIGMVHMDVKPDNIYTAAGRGLLRAFSAPAAAVAISGGGGGSYGSGAMYKLGDFGLAMMQGSTSRRAGVSEGDCRYLAPEVFQTRDFLGTGLADRLDIFALGATTYELLRGAELPRNGQEYLDVRAGRLVLPGVDTRLLTLLKKMMAPDPTQRPTAEQILKMPVLSPGSSSGIYQLLRRQSQPALAPPPRLPISRRGPVAPCLGPPTPGIGPLTPYYSLAPYQLGHQQSGVARRSVSCTR